MRRLIHTERASDKLEDRLATRLNRIGGRVDQALNKRLPIIPVDFIQSLIIEDKEHKRQRFNLYEHQKQILKVVNDQILKKRPVRTILLKPRQCGGSVLYCAIVYYLVTRFNVNAVIIGHKEKSSQNLFKKIELFYRNDPYFNRGEIKPDRKNAKLIRFPSGAELEVVTAGSPDAVTGSTYQVVLATEMALWPENKAADQLRGLLNTVSDKSPMTFVFIESTGRPATEYQSRWNEAYARRSKFEPIFVSWTDVAEYQLPLTPEQRLQIVDTYSLDEEELSEEYGATPEQIAWYRDTLANKCRGATVDAKLADFNSEFPLTPELAFSSQDSAAFPTTTLSGMLGNAVPPLFIGECLTHNRPNVPWSQLSLPEHEDKFNKVFITMRGGRLKIWEKPQQYVQYAIGCDVSEGIVTGENERDDSAFIVRRCDTGLVVATWIGKIPPEDLGDYLYAVGLYYNTAYIAVERNSIGYATLSRLTSCYPLYAVYKQRTLDQDETDTYGFFTSHKNKNTVISQLAYAIRNDEFRTYDINLINELLKITMDRNGKIKTGGCDLTMAAVLSEESRRASPNFNRKIEPVELTPYEQWKRWIKKVNRYSTVGNTALDVNTFFAT